MKSDITTREASSIQEQRISKKFSLKRTPNSGAGRWKKGDLYDEKASLLVEAKTCVKEKDSFSIKKEWLKKSNEEAFFNSLHNYVIAFSFSYNSPQDYYVINDTLMKFLIEKLREQEDI